MHAVVAVAAAVVVVVDMMAVIKMDVILRSNVTKDANSDRLNRIITRELDDGGSSLTEAEQAMVRFYLTKVELIRLTR